MTPRTANPLAKDARGCPGPTCDMQQARRGLVRCLAHDTLWRPGFPPERVETRDRDWYVLAVAAGALLCLVVAAALAVISA